MKSACFITIVVLVLLVGFLFMQSWRDALAEAQNQGDLRVLARFHAEYLRKIDKENGLAEYQHAVHELVVAHANHQSLSRYERFLNQEQ
jgi:hypothetical protein